MFIITCGFTHFMDAYVIWNPVYWLDGGLRIITAIASVGTIVLPSEDGPERSYGERHD